MTFTKSGIALIIGGTSGMGFATAKQLAGENVPVIIVGNRAEKMDKAVTQLQPLGNVSGIQLNLYDVESVSRFIDQVEALEQRVEELERRIGLDTPSRAPSHHES